MAKQRFLSWPPGWRKALPWGCCLFGLVVVGALIVGHGVRSGWGLFPHELVDLAIMCAFLIVGFTAFAARFWAENPDDQPGDGTAEKTG